MSHICLINLIKPMTTTSSSNESWYNYHMQIHFVCSGNTYRSRMAAAYCNSLQLPGIMATSSGTNAETDTTLIEWYAQRILEKYGLASHAASHWRQTTSENIEASDIIIFFEPRHYEFAKGFLDPQRQRYEIWNISDVDTKNDLKLIEESENCFQQIKSRVDALAQQLSAESASAKQTSQNKTTSP